MSKVVFFHTERGYFSTGNLYLGSANLVDFYIYAGQHVSESVLMLPVMRNQAAGRVSIPVPPAMEVRTLPYPEPEQGLVSKTGSLVSFISTLLNRKTLSTISNADATVSAGLEFNGMMFGIICSVVMKKKHAFIVRGNRLKTLKKSSRSLFSKLFARSRVRLYKGIMFYLLKRDRVQVWFQGQEQYEVFSNVVGDRYSHSLYILNAALRELPEVTVTDNNEKPVMHNDLIYTGRITYEKGIKDLLDSIDLLLKSGRKVSAIIVGVGPYLEEAKALTKSLGLSELVHFAGYINNVKELYSYVNNASIFVLPSHTEGLPRSMLESMASGTPVLVTDVGGIPYVIKDGVNGYLVKPSCPQCLAEKVATLLDQDGNERKKVVEKARIDAKQFTFEERSKVFLASILDGNKS